VAGNLWLPQKGNDEHATEVGGKDNAKKKVRLARLI
jgi:hypothetical protein